MRRGSFLAGLLAPFRGLVYLIRHPGLYHLAALPAFLGLALWSGIVALTIPRVNAVVNSYVPATGWAHTLLYFPAIFIAGLAVLMLAAVLVNLLGTLLAAPFNDALSAKVEQYEGRLPSEASYGMSGQFARLGATIVDELSKWGFYLLLLGMLLPLWLIPVVGQMLWTVLGSLLTFWFLGFEYLDYCFSRRQMRFRQRRAFLWSHATTMVGLGVTVTGCMAVPLASFVMMPFAVVGATLLYLELTK